MRFRGAKISLRMQGQGRQSKVVMASTSHRVGFTERTGRITFWTCPFIQLGRLPMKGRS